MNNNKVLDQQGERHGHGRQCFTSASISGPKMDRPGYRSGSTSSEFPFLFFVLNYKIPDHNYGLSAMTTSVSWIFCIRCSILDPQMMGHFPWRLPCSVAQRATRQHLHQKLEVALFLSPILLHEASETLSSCLVVTFECGA